MLNANPDIRELTGTDLEEVVAENPHQRFELIEGVLYEMPPTGIEHGNREFRVAYVLEKYNEKHQWGTILTGEVGFYTRDNKKTVRAADVAFISYSRMAADETVRSYGEIAPELIVEIVSPGDRAGEIETKVYEWLDFGVSIVWIVYPQSQRIHVFTDKRQPEIYSKDDILTGGDVLSGLEIAINDIFK
ncbi:MAG: Uma2 family endonuclease [Aggregatilineales bacterium]